MNTAAIAPQVAAWMVISVLLSGGLALCAVLLHRLARGAFATRLVWGTTLGLSLVLAVSLTIRRAPSTPELTLTPAAMSTASLDAAPRTPWQHVDQLIEGAMHGSQQLMHSIATITADTVRSWPAAVQWAVLLLWPVTTLVLVVVGAWSYRRQHAAVQSATRMMLGGHEVYVTPNVGPAVFGTRRPRVVMPAWLLTRPAEEQRLVVQHEQAHIAAHDPLLLLSGCLAVAVLPWNPVVWYLLSRLRLAIELDCDARVLAAGASTRRYGELLIDLSAASAPLPLFTGAPAFSHRATHLERRIRNMTDRPGSLRTTRRFLALAVTSAALLAACGAEMPTSAELERMDVASAEKRLTTLTPSTTSEYLVDGRKVTESEAKALRAENIGSIDVRTAEKGTNVISIQSVKASYRKTAGDSVTLTIREEQSPAGALKKTFTGLVIIDGVKSTADDMNKLSPSRIASVQVIKGASAEALYGAEGSNGVISITTKR